MKVYIILFLISVLKLNASTDSIGKHTFGVQPIYSIRADANFASVTGNSSFNSVGLNGSLQYDYYFKDKMIVGGYFGFMTDMSNKQRFYTFDNKVFDLTTAKVIFYGLSVGTELWREGRFAFTPDVRLGLGHFSVREINQSQNNNFALTRTIVMLIPRANFSYLIGDRIEPGISFSYLAPASLNGDISHYDLGNVSSSIFCRILF